MKSNLYLAARAFMQKYYPSLYITNLERVYLFKNSSLVYYEMQLLQQGPFKIKSIVGIGYNGKIGQFRLGWKIIGKDTV